MNTPIYLDNNSTTRVDPRVVAAMLPYFDTHYGNASSTSHAFGWVAKDAVESSVETIAACLGAESREIVLTSGATEAINLAIKGAAPVLERKGRHAICSRAEHKAGIDPMKRLEKQGWNVTWLTPDASGLIAREQVAEAITDQTSLVSIMLANNEIGTILPIAEIAEICHASGIVLHTDATQAIGKIPVHVDDLGADLLSFSAHKFYGPKGIGGLYVRRRERPVRLAPQIEGGGHQRGLRSGTLPVPLIVAMAEAMRLATENSDDEATRLTNLRDMLESLITQSLAGVERNGHKTLRIPNTANLRFAGVSGEALMLAMKDVAVSSGSACSAADPEPSHVLKAIGLSDDEARSSLRFSLGRFSTEDDVRKAAERVTATVAGLREGNIRKGPE
jgi:cysteine desulfurase